MQELAKVADLQGYTGRPIYSTWLGPESEQRAVFVDEVKCVGCLKCALFAQKTFAVESVYGRARVVAQWADPEHKIHDAIASCPVDCISYVILNNIQPTTFIYACWIHNCMLQSRHMIYTAEPSRKKKARCCCLMHNCMYVWMVGWWRDPTYLLWNSSCPSSPEVGSESAPETPPVYARETSLMKWRSSGLDTLRIKLPNLNPMFSLTPSF